MKKICMIVPSFTAKGGIAAVVNGYRGSELEKKYAIHYIETYCDGTKPAKFLKAVAAYLRFVKELAVFRPDIIHIHSSFGASFYRKLPFIWLGSALRIPIVNHIHGAEWDAFYSNATKKSKRLKRTTLRKCNRVIALSNDWRKNLGDVVDSELISVVPNYSLPMHDSQDVQKQSIVLFLGFLSKRKGCFDIPQIVAQVQNEVEDVLFVIAGSGTNDDVHRISELVEKEKVVEHLSFPGWVRDEQKKQLMQKAAVFFLPSYAEGMPMSILEAMGHGLPIVSSNVGGIPELVEQERNGYICDPGDTKAFADAIVTLLQDAQLRNTMGKESIRIIEERYSLEHHIDALASVYESLC